MSPPPNPVQAHHPKAARPSLSRRRLGTSPARKPRPRPTEAAPSPRAGDQNLFTMSKTSDKASRRAFVAFVNPDGAPSPPAAAAARPNRHPIRLPHHRHFRRLAPVEEPKRRSRPRRQGPAASIAAVGIATEDLPSGSGGPWRGPDPVSAPSRRLLVEPDGVEPTTSCVQSRRSPN